MMERYLSAFSMLRYLDSISGVVNLDVISMGIILSETLDLVLVFKSIAYMWVGDKGMVTDSFISVKF